MQGAREYASLFKTGQYGRLWIESHSHARGKTFKIYVLPPDVVVERDFIFRTEKVEVYGITSGQPGWTETYGWLHKGKWQEDFEKLVVEAKNELLKNTVAKSLSEFGKAAEEWSKREKLLGSYE